MPNHVEEHGSINACLTGSSLERPIDLCTGYLGVVMPPCFILTSEDWTDRVPNSQLVKRRHGSWLEFYDPVADVTRT